jgi:hypothetical protein
MELRGPQSETEERYIAMVRRFIAAKRAGFHRRAQALGGELDRVAAAIGTEREAELLRWLMFRKSD